MRAVAVSPLTSTSASARLDARWTPAEVEVPDAEASKLSPTAERVRVHLSKRLHDVAEANAAGDRVRAGEILRPVLAAVSTHIAPQLFVGDEAAARSLIIEAFKRGQHELGDAVAHTPDGWAVDYLPSSSKPHAGRLAFEGAPAPTSAEGSGLYRPTSRHTDVTNEEMDRVPELVGRRVENYGHEDLPEGVGDEPAEAPLEPSVAPEPDPPMAVDGSGATEGSPAVASRDAQEPEVIGVQLTLDGSNGRELVRRASGELPYPKRTPSMRKAKAKSATFPTPEVLEAMRVVGVIFDKAEAASLAS